MRALSVIVLSLLSATALAQSPARARPPGLTPLEAPPPPPIVEQDRSVESQVAPRAAEEVTVRTEGDQTIQEFRMNGKVFMVRVTPRHGRPYVMIDHNGDGSFQRQGTLDSGVRVPQWVVAEF